MIERMDPEARTPTLAAAYVWAAILIAMAIIYYAAGII